MATRTNATASADPARLVADKPRLDVPLAIADLFDDETDDTPVLELVQLLLFRLAEEWYAVPLDCVREVRRGCSVSPLPCVPDFVLGVMGLRGEVLSVIDLGRLMRIGGLRGDCVTMPAVVVENDDCVTTVVVDELGDIVEIPITEVEPPLSGVDRSQAAFLLGTAEIGDKMVGLLDTDRLLQPVGEKPRGQRI